LRWFEQHKALIRELVTSKYKGSGDSFPTEVAPSQASTPPQTQMPKIPGANLNSTVGLIQGGVNIWNAVAAQRSTAEQGAWGYDC
jgi:hypothetical protein